MFYSHSPLPLTCSFDALWPFSIEGPGGPEVNSWLPTGHDTVKGLPKRKSGIWRAAPKPSVTTCLPSRPAPLPETCLLPPLSKQDESQGSSCHQSREHTQDHGHPGCGAVGRALLACRREDMRQTDTKGHFRIFPDGHLAWSRDSLSLNMSSRKA